MADTPGRFLERNASLMLGLLSGVITVGWFAVSQQITNAKLEILTAIDAKYATKEGLNELKDRVRALEDHKRYTLGSSTAALSSSVSVLQPFSSVGSSVWPSLSSPLFDTAKTAADGASSQSH